MLLSASLLMAKDYALVVTIGKYKHSKGLKGANIDRKIYHKILKKWGISNIISLHNHQATAKNILFYLADIAHKIQKGDRFYMFFSGHGSSLRDPLRTVYYQEAGLTALL